jgi:hypothetical protein
VIQIGYSDYPGALGLPETVIIGDSGTWAIISPGPLLQELLSSWGLPSNQIIPTLPRKETNV